ncbi:MAG: hypothetical protein KF690_05265 [Bacteroidetes bacterium]|nr:hypothetical protein [Bacteroidota bacterium]
MQELRDSLSVLQQEKKQLSMRYADLKRNTRSTDQYTAGMVLQDSLAQMEKKEGALLDEMSGHLEKIEGGVSRYEVSAMDSVLDKPLHALDGVERAELNEVLKEIKHSNDPDLYKKLYKVGLVSKWEKFLLDVDCLQLGTATPFFSEMSLSGIPVLGLNAELSPGRFYLGVCAFQARLAAPAQLDILRERTLDNYTGGRSAYGLSTGLGSQRADHLHVHSIYFSDQKVTGNISPADTLLAGPGQNLVCGADFEKKLGVLPLKVAGEVNLASLAVDSRIYALRWADIAGWQERTLLTGRDSLLQDWGGALSLTWQSRPTWSVQATVRRVGAAYYSMGNPFLRRGLEQYGVSAQKTFRWLSYQAGVLYEQSTPNQTHAYRSYGVNQGISITLPGFPVLSVSSIQSLVDFEGVAPQLYHVINGQLAHTIRIRDVQGQVYAGIMWHNMGTEIEQRLQQTRSYTAGGVCKWHTQHQSSYAFQQVNSTQPYVEIPALGLPLSSHTLKHEYALSKHWTFCPQYQFLRQGETTRREAFGLGLTAKNTWLSVEVTTAWNQVYFAMRSSDFLSGWMGLSLKW